LIDGEGKGGKGKERKAFHSQHLQRCSWLMALHGGRKKKKKKKGRKKERRSLLS